MPPPILRPFRPAAILAPDVVIEPRGVYARSPHSLGPYPRAITDRLDTWADRAPDRIFLAERDPAGAWRTMTFAEVRTAVRALSQALLGRRLSPERPIVMLSGNSIEHGLLALAAMIVGVPYAPLAPTYALVSQTHATLKVIWASLDPQLVFVADPVPFARVLSAVCGPGTEVVTSVNGEAVPSTSFADLLETSASTAVDEAQARVTPDTIAKILFTSGSTGAPKGVINTQRMLCANQQMLCQVLPFMTESPPVLCDWLPWNHTFGGNHNFGAVLYNGGTLYIDQGRPIAGAFDTTLANLRDVATTAYFNVPRGYEMLLPTLREDVQFRRHFFSRLQMLFYAAAGLRQEVADEIDALAVDACGERIVWVTGLGSTESAPLAMCTGAQMTSTARVGVPVPGVELKLGVVGERREARFRGPNITPGYWRDADLTKAAFDDEGYYCMGDALAPADAADPQQGWVLEGRLADDFKLSTGTWVRVGPLRARFLSHAGELVQDIVITGEGRDRVGALILPNLDVWRRVAGFADGAGSIAEVVAHPACRDRLTTTLETFSAEHPGSSTGIAMAIVLEEPPSVDAQEITDKGALNQRAVLRHRAALVDQLYGAPGPASPITTKGSS